jgi:transcriptional regulator with XRE-family HTH domain
LRKLGADIRDARLRRRIPEKILAARALISRMTLYRITRGDSNVTIGSYASVLFALGLSDKLADLAAASTDAIGLALEEERLPRRVRQRRQPRTVLPAKPGTKQA